MEVRAGDRETGEVGAGEGEGKREAGRVRLGRERVSKPSVCVTAKCGGATPFVKIFGSGMTPTSKWSGIFLFSISGIRPGIRHVNGCG
jgi:hypothetical protein